jgi:hypothetical protein
MNGPMDADNIMKGEIRGFRTLRYSEMRKWWSSTIHKHGISMEDGDFPSLTTSYINIKYVFFAGTVDAAYLKGIMASAYPHKMERRQEGHFVVSQSFFWERQNLHKHKSFHVPLRSSE